MAEPLLVVSGLTKHFAALAANSGIALEMGRGEVLAVIGPNGAGKTTLLSQLAGELRPSAGTIMFDAVDITGLPPYRRSMMGMARTFQTTSLFKDFSVLENVAISAQGHLDHSFRFWRAARRDERLNAAALEALQQVGLQARMHDASGDLSHGEQRLLEIAMAFVTRPKLVLLDEPTAGMGTEESSEIVYLLKTLKGKHAMLLIEHDMDVVFAIADRITVLVGGRVIASGTPEDIRADASVREAYLGEGAAELP
jgi:branched-chain amino acid transport system ATP-binding protein